MWISLGGKSAVTNAYNVVKKTKFNELPYFSFRCSRQQFCMRFYFSTYQITELVLPPCFKQSSLFVSVFNYFRHFLYFQFGTLGPKQKPAKTFHKECADIVVDWVVMSGTNCRIIRIFKHLNWRFSCPLEYFISWNKYPNVLSTFLITNCI